MKICNRKLITDENNIYTYDNCHNLTNALDHQESYEYFKYQALHKALVFLLWNKVAVPTETALTEFNYEDTDLM